MNSSNVTGMLDTMIIGGGQAGLALGHHLKEQQRNFLILDANQRTGDAWRQRWDSLQLFTPAKFDGLPGEPFPADPLSFPTKDEVAGYLENYAAGKGLPILHGTRVERLWREADHFVAASNGRRWEARNAVVATGVSQAPKVPAFAAELAPPYSNSTPAATGIRASCRTGRSWWWGWATRGGDSPRGMPVPPHYRGGQARRRASSEAWPRRRPLCPAADPLRWDACAHAWHAYRAQGGARLHSTRHTPDQDQTNGPGGGRRAARTAGGRNRGRQAGPGEHRMDVANVIWCRGSRDYFSWIDPDLLDAGALPRQHRGVALDTPGLFFLGQEFLYAAGSATLPGVGRDARYLAARIPAPLNRESAVAPLELPRCGLGQPFGDNTVDRRIAIAAITMPTRFSNSWKADPAAFWYSPNTRATATKARRRDRGDRNKDADQGRGTATDRRKAFRRSRPGSATISEYGPGW